MYFSPSPIYTFPHYRQCKTYIQSGSGRVWNHAGKGIIQTKPADGSVSDYNQWRKMKRGTITFSQPWGGLNASSENTHPLLALRSRHQRTDSGALSSWHHMAMLRKPLRSSYYRQEKASPIADGCHRAAQHQYPRGLHWTFGSQANLRSSLNVKDKIHTRTVQHGR